MNTKIPWEEFCNSTSPHVLILDEIQISYSNKNCGSLWGWVKENSILPENNQSCILFIGSYGGETKNLGTPFTFSPNHTTSLNPPSSMAIGDKYPLPGLLFSEEEFLELVQVFEKNGFSIDKRITNFIFHITNGHAGFTKQALYIIYQVFHNTYTQPDFLEKLYEYIHTSDFISLLSDNRGKRSFDLLSKTQLSICDAVFLNQDIALGDFKQADLDDLIKVFQLLIYNFFLFIH